MRFFVLVGLLLVSFTAPGQHSVDPIYSKLALTDNVPDQLLAKRSCVFYNSGINDEALELIQKTFQNTGIDAVAYFKKELVFAGLEVTDKIMDYLIKREIDFIILIIQSENKYSFTITPFNGKQDFVNEGQPAWSVVSANPNDALQTIYRTAVNNQPIKNLLINSYPERNFPTKIIEGRRSDFFAIDLKVDRLAVPWFKEANKDTLLVNFFKDNYPFQYGMVEPGLDKRELRNKGFHYILHYLHTEGAIAKDILGYQTPSSESAITSVTYPNGEIKLKTLSAETPIYKFYLKHLESGNVFLGTKWDADVTWLDALRNQIKGFKSELK
ncbi:MAG TPA: hypothetical protein VIS49_09135 [Cyclobacteriaceae bacterium]